MRMYVYMFSVCVRVFFFSYTYEANALFSFLIRMIHLYKSLLCTYVCNSSICIVIYYFLYDDNQVFFSQNTWYRTLWTFSNTQIHIRIFCQETNFHHLHSHLISFQFCSNIQYGSESFIFFFCSVFYCNYLKIEWSYSRFLANVFLNYFCPFFFCKNFCNDFPWRYPKFHLSLNWT